MIFPNIHTIIWILLTFPVTTCECERSISILNRVKSFNRTTQTDQRLTGLCIICAYRDVAIDWEKVVKHICHTESKKNGSDKHSR